jgi:hypothetical protein
MALVIGGVVRAGRIIAEKINQRWRVRIFRRC